jgi:hypothetical protein
VVPVNVSGYADGIKALIAGKLDVCMVTGGSGLAAEAAAAPGGLYWIPLPIENKEGWKRYLKVNPFHAPIQAHYGENIPKDNTNWYAGAHFPNIFAHATADEDRIYWMAKAIAESFPYYKDTIKPVMSWWSVESFLKVPKLFPLHNGVIRYLKEKGLWTDEMDAKNRMLIEKGEELKAAWKVVTSEADEKKLSDKEFGKRWLKKLDEIKLY